MQDENPRPSKRQRASNAEFTQNPKKKLAQIPPPILLASLPTILLHPPHHRRYAHSLYLSLVSLRKCLNLKALSPDIECRAWTMLAEVGMKVVGGGFSQSGDHPWASGIEQEVEKAIGKALLISQKHSSLRLYRHHLNLLNAKFSEWQHNFKFARSILRKLLSSFIPADPPHVVYTAHLAYITHLASSPSNSPSLHDAQATLDAVQALQSLATTNQHLSIVLLTHILRLRILVAAEMWQDVQTALNTAENVLGLSYQALNEPAATYDQQQGAATDTPSVSADAQETTFISFEDPFEASMAVHTLIIAVAFYTHLGVVAEVTPRLSHLHALMDSGVTEKFREGYVEIKLPPHNSLYLQITHPQVIFHLVYLLSAVGKRDVVGRRPKRKIFATKGLAVLEKEALRELALPMWASVEDVQEIEQRIARIKADLLSELIAVSIMRSEFDSANENLAILIAHTRTYDLFEQYAPRITLHHAHLAHALGDNVRALQCYQVAAHLADAGSFIAVAARVGEITLQIGIEKKSDGEIEGATRSDEDITSNMEAVKECQGQGGVMRAIAKVIEASLSPEILKSKQHLKDALSIASKAQDNYLRAFILAFISSHYFHTSVEHAQAMLLTSEQLAAGLGASEKVEKGGKKGEAVGNAPLRFWIGKRFLDLYKRGGQDDRVQKQIVINQRLAKAVENLAQRNGLPKS